MMRALVVVFGMSCLLFADDAPKQKLRVVHTEHAQLPAGGLLRLIHSTGEVTIEGWDRPDIEITTVKSTQETYTPAERQKASAKLDKVRVAIARRGNELVITTAYPRYWGLPASSFDLAYRIMVPRSTNLAIAHGNGEVHIDNLASNMQIKVSRGSITTMFPQGPYSINARAQMGDVTSDFPGTTKRLRVFGHSFMHASGSHKVNLKVGFGDIMIVKAEKPLGTF